LIIGITGYTGSGKSTVAEILHEKGFKIVEMRDAVVEEMKKRGMEINSKSMREFATKLREEEGNDVVARLTYEKIKGEKGNVAITGMRSTYEEEYFRNKIKNFLVLAVVAPERTRFERIKKRNKPDDPKTFEEFKRIESMELNGFSGKRDPAHGLQSLIDHADLVIFNTSTKTNLKKDVEKLVEYLEKA